MSDPLAAWERWRTDDTPHACSCGRCHDHGPDGATCEAERNGHADRHGGMNKKGEWVTWE